MDSLPIESLTESANETAKVGQVTGALADALNWAGVSEDEFNQSLAQCNSEQERSTLITETLNGLYQEASDNYKEANADIIASRKAQSDLNDTIAEFGAIAEPILTKVKELANGLLESMLPMVEMIGEGLKGVMDGTEGASQQLADGISGIINNILNMAMNLLPTLAQVLGEVIGNVVTELLNSTPRLVEVIMEIATQLIALLGELVPQIVVKLSEVIPQILQAILTYAPSLLDACIQLLHGIVEALPIVIENLISALPSLITAIIDFLVGSFQMLVDGAISLFYAILDALPVIIEALIVNLPKIIEAITTSLVGAIPLILEASVKMLNALIDALPTIVGLLIDNLPTLIITIQKTLLESYPQLIGASIKMFTAIIKAIPQIIVELGKALGEIGIAIIEGLGKIDLLDTGKEIIRGLIKGMASVGKEIWGAITDIGESVIDGFVDFFDIHSPSRKVKNKVGKNVGEAVGVGAVESIPKIKEDINTLSDSVYNEFDTLGANTGANNSRSIADDGNINRLIDRLDNLENVFKNLKIVLNNDVLVGELMPSIDTGLGNLATARERGR